MANHTSAPEDDYDVLIEDDLSNNEVELCTPYDPKVLSAQLVPYLYTTVFVAGLLDNLLVVFILVKYRRSKQAENTCFFNLALSNLCFLLTLPFWAHAASRGEGFDDPLCTILLLLSSVGLYSEALFSALLAVRGYQESAPGRGRFSACRPVASRTFVSALVWVTAILVTLPELVFYKPQMESQKYKCFFIGLHFLPADETSWKHFLTLKMNILGFLLPLFALIYCCMRMGRTRQFRQRNYDLCKLVSTITAVFLLMWGPYNIALFLSAFNEQLSLHGCGNSYNLNKTVQITRIIAATHCCINPLLYVFLDKAFRKHLGHLCHLCSDTAPQPTEDPAQGTSGEEYHLTTEMETSSCQRQDK